MVNIKKFNFMEVWFIAQVKQLNVCFLVIPQPSTMTKSHLYDKIVVKKLLHMQYFQDIFIENVIICLCT